MTTMNTAQQRLYESSFDPWESVSTALEGAQGRELTPRMQWLVAHLTQTKQGYWQAIGEAIGHSYAPPQSLSALLNWELEQAALLSETELSTPLEYSLRAFSVASLLRLNARHSTWHAGQLMMLARHP